ncbi:ATP phosphoribosyltransferase regulatory subunit [Teredinibacter purpureus]|uniref:ATP phosphoribosyltransferase regulatory subunit n=1 Tax=Teredinibacter purpureus TaxID=2731756 RepID=UPI0005F819B9|nr:ATP phosphoribosyltransferase regulatory subunit [Teredinibacter purpureus]
MSRVDRWLLPDGIEELLPEAANKVEGLRRRLVDTFKCWGYDYVIPPMVEFTDSLLTGSGRDIELLTFKVTDLVSGKTMGIRADMTPQAARMDAHSLKREGVNRLCYAGHVLHTRPKAPLASRTPVWAGVELFGEPGIDADLEVISLLLSTLQAAGLDKQYIDIGHVGIFRALSEAASLDEAKEEALFNLLQAKATTEIQRWVEDNIDEEYMRNWFIELPKLSGSVSTLARAQEVFAEAPAEVAAALDELAELAKVLQPRYPEAQLYFDLSELRGYHYHTGIVFGAFAPGLGEAIANGGRYDHIGEAFGRPRPATGFNVDLTAISQVVEVAEKVNGGIFAPSVSDTGVGTRQWQKISELRAAGERVVVALSGQTEPLLHQNCNRVLVERNGQFEIESV